MTWELFVSALFLLKQATSQDRKYWVFNVFSGNGTVVDARALLEATRLLHLPPDHLNPMSGKASKKKAPADTVFKLHVEATLALYAEDRQQLKRAEWMRYAHDDPQISSLVELLALKEYPEEDVETVLELRREALAGSE